MDRPAGCEAAAGSDGRPTRSTENSIARRSRTAHLGAGAEFAQRALCQCGAVRIPILYGHARTSLIRENGRLAGVIAEHRRAGRDPGPRCGVRLRQLRIESEVRAKYLGPGFGNGAGGVRDWIGAPGSTWRWRSARGLRPLVAISIRWRRSSTLRPMAISTVGDQELPEADNYPFGILINAKGERYVDEGANCHSHTYAKYGGEIDQASGHVCLAGVRRQGQPSAAQRVSHPPGDQGGSQHARRTGRQARRRGSGVSFAPCGNSTPPAASTPFNPNVLDGRRTQGLAINKTNWAVRSILRRSTPIM